MTFWDSSAVVPLLVDQQASARVSTWLAADEGIVVWTLTVVEVSSALGRLVREHAISEELARQAEARADELARSAHVVTDMEPVKQAARRLVRFHPLRAFDALQLAAALHWAEGQPQGRTLHTLDDRLGLAARREGFVVPA